MTVELRLVYDQGFILTEASLKDICKSLTRLMETFADNVSATFTLKYRQDGTVVRPDIIAILNEENGETHTVNALTIMLTGTENDTKTASITLTFADTRESIVCDIRSTDEEWIRIARNHVEALVEQVIKQSNANLMAQLASKARGLSRLFPFFSSFYLAGIIADFIIRSLDNAFISSDHIFFWGGVQKAIEKKRQDVINKVREVAVVVIFIGLIVGIVAGIIANYITLYILKWRG